MRSSKLLFVVVLAVVMISEAFALPFLERIYGLNSNGYRQTHLPTKRVRVTARSHKPRGRSYKDICRAVNPAPYSFPNKIPYPSVPIC